MMPKKNIQNSPNSKPSTATKLVWLSFYWYWYLSHASPRVIISHRENQWLLWSRVGYRVASLASGLGK